MLKLKLLLCILFCIPLLLSAQGDWQTEQIPKINARDGVNFQDIAYSADGSVHVIFGETTRQGTNLVYTKKSGDTWTDPLIIQDEIDDFYSFTITVDNTGIAHVIFADNDGTRVRLYYWNSNTDFGNPTEVITNVYTSFSVKSPSIAIDGNQNLHITFFNKEVDGKISVRYANNISGTFNQCEIIDPPLTNGFLSSTDIAVDENNNVGIVFSRSTDPIPAGRIYFSSNASGTFIEPVEVSILYSDTSDTYSPQIAMYGGCAYITYEQWGESCGCVLGPYNLYFTKVQATTGESIIAPVTQFYHSAGYSAMDFLPGSGGNPAEIHIAFLDRYEVILKKYTIGVNRQQYMVVNGDDGSILQQPVIVYDEERVLRPALQLDDQGFAHMVFEGGNDPIYATNIVIPGGNMHITDVQVTAQTAGNKVMGIATVTIKDENGTPVPDVTVSGVWSGMTSDSDQFQTAADGSGTCESDKVNKKSSGYFTFTVTDVSRSGWTYDPEANVENSDTTPWNFAKPMAALSGIIPETTELLGNYPNPFNPSTTIRYQLADEQQVSLTIYNITGKLVKQMTPIFQQPGVYEYIWNGTNFSGQQVASGVYVYALQTGNIKHTKKMILNR